MLKEYDGITLLVGYSGLSNGRVANCLMKLNEIIAKYPGGNAAVQRLPVSMMMFGPQSGRDAIISHHEMRDNWRIISEASHFDVGNGNVEEFLKRIEKTQNRPIFVILADKDIADHYDVPAILITPNK